MALPVKVIDVNTAGWSDHKNQNHGGVQQVRLVNTSDDNGTFTLLGDTIEFAGPQVTVDTAEAGHKLLRIRFYLQKVGSPSGTISVRLCPDASGLPDLGNPMALSLSYPLSSIPTSGKNEVIFTFPIPATLPAAASNYWPILTLSAQGNGSNHVKVYMRGSGLSRTRDYGSGSWNLDTASQPSHFLEISQSGAFVFAADKTNNKARGYKSTDNNGSSWAEHAASGAPGILSTSGMKSIGAQGFISDLDTSYISMFTGGTNAGTYKLVFSPINGWSLVAQKAFGAVNTNVSGTGPIGGGRRPNGNLVMIVQGATETNMGAPWRRIKLAYWNGSTWSSEFDVVGSANTPDATLPGNNVHYDLRWSIVDPNGDCHIIFSRSDSSMLQYRKFKSDNTFATVNTLNGAVASATVNYSVGQGAMVYKSPDWYVVVPYVDNSSNTLKEARCKTTITETSSNWTLTQISDASAETSGSNPAVLMADNAQGGKVFCWRVKPTTKGLSFTHDSGNSTYVPETDWRGATQTVGGISGFYVEDGIALVYLEEGTSPDELRYDRL